MEARCKHGPHRVVAPEQPTSQIKELRVGPYVATSCLVTLSQSDRILGKPPVLFTDLIEEKENWSPESMSVHDVSAIGRLHIDI